MDMRSGVELCSVADIEEPNLLDTRGPMTLPSETNRSSVLDSEEEDEDDEYDDELGPLKGVKPEKARWTDAEVRHLSVFTVRACPNVIDCVYRTLHSVRQSCSTTIRTGR